MSNINQLLAKALSTTSEEEAMSCLRMARKKGGRLEDSGSSDYNGHGAKYWYDKAATYYAKVKENADGLTLTQQKQLYRMFRDETESVVRLLKENSTLKDEISKLQELKNKPTGVRWMAPVIGIQFILILVLIQLIG